MARSGRPKKEIDKDQFEKLCGLQCTEEEIASFFNCSVDTIGRFCKKEYGSTFAEVFKKKQDIGKISLRRNQWKLAEKSATMAIWMGKQYLNQTDRIEATVTQIDAEHRKSIEDFLHDEGSDEDTTSDT